MAGEILFSKCTLVILESWDSMDCALCRTFQRPWAQSDFPGIMEAGMEEREYDTLRQNVEALLEKPRETEPQRQRSNELE